MTTIEDAQTLLMPLKIVIETETKENFIVSFMGKKWNIPIIEIEEFLTIKEKIISDPNTSIYYPGYYEHLIELDMQLRNLSYPIRRTEEKQELVNHDGSIIITISQASTSFILNALQTIEPLILRRRLLIPGMVRREESKEVVDNWTNAFRRIKTIKITTSKENSVLLSQQKFRQLAGNHPLK